MPKRRAHQLRLLIVVSSLLIAGIGFGVAYWWWGSEEINDPLAAKLMAEADRARQRKMVRPKVGCRPATRWLEIEGASNARDIGGYPTTDGRKVCWNRVYRSGDLSRLTSKGCEAFAGLGIRRVVDFRNRFGLSSSFGGDAECVFDVTEMSLLPIRGDVVEPRKATYSDLLHGNVESIRETFQLIADPENLPLLYHCTAGKDRTGIVTVLLLSLLGVDRETILEDFELSVPVAGAGRPHEILAIFDEIDALGGIENYLMGLGIDMKTQQSIRAQLLE